MKNTLIIGGSGYIGSALHTHIANSTTLDTHWYGGPTPDIKCDFNTIDKTFLKQFDVVILLAGHSSVAMCTENFNSCWKNNVDNFSQLLDKLDNQLLIYASSGSVYGSQHNTLCKETDKLILQSQEYDFTKKVIEQIAINSNKNTVGLRLGTVNGLSPNTRTDLMLNQMVQVAKLTKRINVTSGDNYRSILGINDCVNVFKQIISSMPEGCNVYNVSSQNGKILDFANAIKNHIDVEIINEDKITSNFSFQLDTTAFQQDFNFKFEDTLDSIIDCLAKNNYVESVRKNTHVY